MLLLARGYMGSSSWRVSIRLIPRSKEPRCFFHPGAATTIVIERVVRDCAGLETIETMVWVIHSRKAMRDSHRKNAVLVKGLIV